jgi:hypothetical protein
MSDNEMVKNVVGFLVGFSPLILLIWFIFYR